MAKLDFLEDPDVGQEEKDFLIDHGAMWKLNITCRGGEGCCTRDHPCEEVGRRPGSMLTLRPRVWETVTGTTSARMGWSVARTTASGGGKPGGPGRRRTTAVSKGI